MIVTPLEIVRAAKRAGFVYNQGLLIICAISFAENPKHDTTAVYVNTDTWTSKDRGLWMLNDHWHSEVSDTCAFDIDCAAKETYRISGQGKSFSSWAVYQSGKYRNYMELARAINDLDEALSAGEVVTSALQSMQLQYDAVTVERDTLKDSLANCTTKVAVSKAALTEIRDQAASALSAI